MAEKSSSTAKAAFVLSVLTAAFTAYQWWSSREESRITSAIEISTSYIQDQELAKQQKLLARFIAEPKIKATNDDRRAVYHYIARLEYVAYLINTGRIDPNFIALTIKCDLSTASEAMNIVAPVHLMEFKGVAELRKISAKFDHPCSAE
jgi:hypothetical protein